jgi:hypothetical protein
MIIAQIREFFIHGLSDSLTPETRSSKDIGLINRVNSARWRLLLGKKSSQSGNTFDFLSGIGEGIIGLLIIIEKKKFVLAQTLIYAF